MRQPISPNARRCTASRRPTSSTKPYRRRRRAPSPFSILSRIRRRRSKSRNVIETLALPKATAYRLVDGLISSGYLAREPARKRLTVGSRLTDLAFGTMRASMRNSSRHALLRRLVHQVNETCNIGIMLNGEIVYLDRVEAEHWPLRLQFGAGSRVPLHCSAIGKLYLALAPAPRRRRLLQSLELRRYTDAHHHRADAARRRTAADPQGASLVRPRGISASASSAWRCR